MKTKLVLLAAVIAALLPQARAESPSGSGSGAVNVVFQNPEKFTDVKTTAMGTDRDREEILGQIKDYVEQSLAKRVPSGQTLTITFRDIDMAGDFEPWRFEARDVRIVKDLYPPRAKVSFTLKDADGKVVKEGERNLSDMTFMTTLQIDRNDELRYEKRLLSDWIDTEFPRNRKS